jgi:hypothetical protein
MTVALAHEILHGHSQLLSQILKRAHLPVARLTNGHAERVGRPVGFGGQAWSEFIRPRRRGAELQRPERSSALGSCHGEN